MKNYTRAAIFLFLSSQALVAYSDNTLDIKADEDRGIRYDIEIEKSVNDKLFFIMDYSQSKGEDFQIKQNTSIQLGGERVRLDDVSRIDYDYILRQTTLGLGIQLVDTEYLAFSVSPRIAYLDYDIDAVTLSQTLNEKVDFVGIGTGIEFKYKATPFLHLGIEASAYAIQKDEVSAEATAIMDFIVNDSLSFGLGFRYWRIDEFFSGSAIDDDFCSSSERATEGCKNSDIELVTRGLLLNMKLSF